jgi:transcriptional regulator NrdR family protein
VVEPPAEVEEPEGRQHCIKCNSLFTPAELGESILKIIKEQHGLIMRQDKQGVEKGEEFRALVEEKAQLKKHIDKQAQLINEINEKLRKSTGKTIDLHALAEFRSHLPNEGKGKNVKAAAGN